MKNKNYILISLLFLAICCTEIVGGSFHITRIIKNESGHHVKIISYYNKYFLYGNPDRDSIVQIELRNGEADTVLADFISDIYKPYLSDDYIETEHSVDSVLVIFDNKKLEVHCNMQKSYCTLNSANRLIIIYDITEIFDRPYKIDNEEWLYTITEEDYSNAQDCNGDPRCN